MTEDSTLGGGEEPPEDEQQALPGEATDLLRRAVAGEEEAADQLLPLVYSQLRALAGSFFKDERREHTLQPTAVVHEAYLRLVGSEQPDYASRSHFLAVAANVMRRVLVDHARARSRQKRGGDWARVTLDDSNAPTKEARGFEAEVLDLHEGLNQLATINSRKAMIVELRWFGGMTVQEIAERLDVTERTVERDWAASKAWLRRFLEDSGTTDN